MKRYPKEKYEAHLLKVVPKATELFLGLRFVSSELKKSQAACIFQAWLIESGFLDLKTGRIVRRYDQ